VKVKCSRRTKKREEIDKGRKWGSERRREKERENAQGRRKDAENGEKMLSGEKMR
jgi:hypothetical protein